MRFIDCSSGVEAARVVDSALMRVKRVIATNLVMRERMVREFKMASGGLSPDREELGSRSFGPIPAQGLRWAPSGIGEAPKKGLTTLKKSIISALVY